MEFFCIKFLSFICCGGKCYSSDTTKNKNKIELMSPNNAKMNDRSKKKNPWSTVVLKVIISFLQVLRKLLVYGCFCPALSQQFAEQSNHPFEQHGQQGEYSQPASSEMSQCLLQYQTAISTLPDVQQRQSWVNSQQTTGTVEEKSFQQHWTKILYN